MKHLREDCSAHHLTFGGYCFNCGINKPKHAKPTVEDRKNRLKELGFSFIDAKPKTLTALYE